MIKIFGSHTPMFLKVIVAAEELKLPYQVEIVDLMKGEQKTPEHLARHPFGKVPVIEHKGEYLFEGNAINRYMASLTETSLYPKDPLTRAKIDQWTDYFSIQAGRWCTSIWYENYLKPVLFKESTDEKRVAEMSELLLEAMPVIENHLAKNRYLAGADFTLADINGFMLVRGFEEAKLNLSDFPNFIKWHDGIKARPSVVSTFAKYW